MEETHPDPAANHRRRLRRRRVEAPAGAPPATALPPTALPPGTPPTADRPEPEPPATGRVPGADPERQAPPRRRREAGDVRLRGLTGAGPSQLPGATAMRARDATRPTADDLAAAERELMIVRRHYVPPEQRGAG